MGKKLKPAFLIVAIVGLVALVAVYLSTHDIAVLHPQGLVAHKEFNLMVFAFALMMVIVIPVFMMTFVIAWKYREGNTEAKYQPNVDGNRLLESLWWGFPLVIILILSVVTWQSSRDLDPFKPLGGEVKPLTIQVVSLQWKWLFIYPKQNIATVNYVEMPMNTPVKFEITSDAPMNSFWIPALGGQMYAMTGMSTELNLMADQPGSYRGSSANISGSGFADMHFVATSVSSDNFNSWVKNMSKSSQQLTMQEYTRLAKPSKNEPVISYSSPDPDLYNKIMMKYMGPMSNSDTMHMSMGQ